MTAALCAHLNRGAIEEVVAALGATVPPAVHRWLAPVLLSAGEADTPAGLARAARCSERTLRRTLRGAGLPAPEELLAWRRLLHAGRLLDDGRSADSVARALDWSSGSALRKSLGPHRPAPRRAAARGRVRRARRNLPAALRRGRRAGALGVRRWPARRGWWPAGIRDGARPGGRLISREARRTSPAHPAPLHTAREP